MLAFDGRIGEPVKLRDIIDGEEIASIDLDHLPLDGCAESTGKDHGKNGGDDQAPASHCGKDFTKLAVISGEISICEAITVPFRFSQINSLYMLQVGKPARRSIVSF